MACPKHTRYCTSDHEGVKDSFHCLFRVSSLSIISRRRSYQVLLIVTWKPDEHRVRVRTKGGAAPRPTSTEYITVPPKEDDLWKIIGYVDPPSKRARYDQKEIRFGLPLYEDSTSVVGMG